MRTKRASPTKPIEFVPSEAYLEAEREFLITHLDNTNLFRKTYVNNPVPKQDRTRAKKPTG